MPETTATAAPQGGEGEEAQGANGTPAQGATPETAQGAVGGEGTATVEALTRKLADLERDNRAYRKREADRDKAEREKSEAEMTEVERLRSENEKLSAKIAEQERREREQSLRVAAVTEATRLGYRNPDLAFRLLSAHVADVEWTADGEPKNVAGLLTDLAKADPYLVTTTDFGGGHRGESATSGAPDMNALIRQAAGAKTR